VILPKSSPQLEAKGLLHLSKFGKSYLLGAKFQSRPLLPLLNCTAMTDAAWVATLRSLTDHHAQCYSRAGN
jgi:hypothetical protein